MGSLSAILDLELETGADCDYAEVGLKRASRQLSGLVMGSRLVGSDLLLRCYVLTESHSGPSRILGSYNDQGISCVGAGFQTASE